MNSNHNFDRRTLLKGGAGMALASLPVLARAGAHDATMPIVAPPIPQPGPGALTIESIEAFWLHDGTKMGAAFPRMFVRIYTREGVVGEAYTFFWHSWDKVMPLINEGIAPLLKGMDAMQIERCWERAWLVLNREFARGVGNSVSGGLKNRAVNAATSQEFALRPDYRSVPASPKSLLEAPAT